MGLNFKPTLLALSHPSSSVTGSSYKFEIFFVFFSFDRSSGFSQTCNTNVSNVSNLLYHRLTHQSSAGFFSSR